mmetsp:Transcript_18882/g.18194  ORF Transcript_18882/g.18194 Transcript_18882/m.18194 type:complete len:158 (+) Transcript_18882:272-745(+)
MVLFLLKMKADLENILELQPQFENLWKFNISSQDSEERLGITVSKADILELNGSKGDANYVMKWHKADSHQAYIKLVDVKKVDGTYKTSGEWTTLLGLECRGLTPTAWIPGVDFHAKSVGRTGTIFESIDLSDKEWAEYDEEGDLSVSIMNLEYKIE